MSDSELPELADYQAKLLELLYSDGEVGEAEVRAAAGLYGTALGELDPVLLQVAATLTKTWGRLE